MIEKVIETDVLAIGGSGAGVTSAIAAAREGVKVTLVSKGKIGYSGNAIMAGGGFSIDGKSAHDICGIKNADSSQTKEHLFENIVKESYYLCDQNMVEQYVEESPTVVNELLQWAEKAKLEFVFVSPATWISAGICWGKSLRQGIKETPVINVVEDTTIVELLTNEGQIVGAIGIDIYTGELILFKANSVILGTGGYQPFSFKNTVTDMTGDGVAMAFRAGADLADMEFLLAFPTALVPHEMKGSIYPFVFEFNMRNLKIQVRDGENNLIEIPEEIEKLSKGTKLSKLVSTYYWGEVLSQGRGGSNGGIYLDYSSNSKEKLEEAFEGFFNVFSKWHKYGYYKGEDLSEVKKMILNNELLEVGLGFEYSMGGILVDEKMQTGVKGLFAAGEVTSGVFGACRVGDGLTEMLAQGYRAGKTASMYSKDIDSDDKKINEKQLKQIIYKLMKPFNTNEGISPLKVFDSIEKAADLGFGVRRNKENLTMCLKELERIKKEDIPNLSVKSKSRKYNYEWITALQAENLIICVEAGVRAALMRTESRGCHIRSDYPEVNHDKWLLRIVASEENGEIKLSTRKPIVTKLNLPKGKDKSIMDYFLNKNLGYKKY